MFFFLSNIWEHWCQQVCVTGMTLAAFSDVEPAAPMEEPPVVEESPDALEEGSPAK